MTPQQLLEDLVRSAEMVESARKTLDIALQQHSMVLLSVHTLLTVISGMPQEQPSDPQDDTPSTTEMF